MEIVRGKYRAKYFDEIPAWRTYYNNSLVAQTDESLWDNEHLIFASYEAGETLLSSIQDILSGMEKVADMVKTDDSEDAADVSENVSESEANQAIGEMHEPECCGQCDKEPGHEPCEDSQEKVIVIKLQKLMDKAKLEKEAGLDYTATFKEIDSLTNYYEELQQIALINKLDILIAKANYEIENGIHNEATLQLIEDLMRQV